MGRGGRLDLPTDDARDPPTVVDPSVGPDAVADVLDHERGVVGDVAGDVARPLLTNPSEIPTCCLRAQLAVLQNVTDVLSYRSARHPKQLPDLPLGQPRVAVCDQDAGD